MIKSFFASRKYHILILLVSVVILTRFEIDPDLGWHIVYGQKFLESGEIIRHDPFSWTMPGYSWGNSYFLYQVLIAFLFGKFGHILTAWVFGLIAASAVLFLLPKKLDFVKALIIFLGIVISQANLGMRPHLFSFWLFSFLIYLLNKRLFAKGKHVIFWFLFFAIWANIHRGFLVGLMVLGVYILLDALIARSEAKSRKFNFPKTAFVCILAGFGGTLVTPFNIKLWQSAVFLDLTSKENLTSIAEWQPIAFYFPINIIYIATGMIFIYVFLKHYKKLQATWFLIAAAIFMFAFVAINFLFYWTAIFIFLVSRSINFRIKYEFSKASFLIKFLLPISTFAVLMAFLLNLLFKIDKSLDLKGQMISEGYPVEAVEFLRNNGQIDGLFNEYSWGGYLIWQFPETKVFIDGRMASWRFSGEQGILEDYLAIAAGKCEITANYGIKAVLVKSDIDWKCFDDWLKVYEDSNAKILLKQR